MAKRILLADDSITIQKVIELTFSDEDFEVVTVGNGRLAIERMAEVRPDVVLCDIIMPERDGYEVCDFVKRHQQFGHVPVLLLTGAFEPFDQERAQRVGADGYLAKPFEPETLIAKVKDLLARQSQRAAVRPAAVVPPAPSQPAPAVVPSAPPVYPAAPPSVPAVALPSQMPRPVPAPPPLQSPPAPFLVPPPPRVPAPPVAVAPPAPAPPLAPLPTSPFIPDEPFAGLDPNSFGAPAAFAEIPPMPEARAAVPSPEATPLSAEETASLLPPAVDEDASTTIFFRTPSDSWSQPTVEVPLEERARASVEAQLGSGSVFEEIVEEEVIEVQTGVFAAQHPPAGAASAGFEALVEEVPEEVPEETPADLGTAEAKAPETPTVEDLVVEGAVAHPDVPGPIEAPAPDYVMARMTAPEEDAAEPPLSVPSSAKASPLTERETDGPEPPPPVLTGVPVVSSPPPVVEVPFPEPAPLAVSALAEAWMEAPAPASSGPVAGRSAEAPPEFIPLEPDAHVAEPPSLPPVVAEEAVAVSTTADLPVAASLTEALPESPEPAPPALTIEHPQTQPAGGDARLLEPFESFVSPSPRTTLALTGPSAGGEPSAPEEVAVVAATRGSEGSSVADLVGQDTRDESVTAPTEGESWADVATSVAPQGTVTEPEPSVAGAVAVAPDMVQQIAQRVIAQISEKFIREIAWEVIPEIAEALIKREIERIKSDLT